MKVLLLVEKIDDTVLAMNMLKSWVESLVMYFYSICWY